MGENKARLQVMTEEETVIKYPSHLHESEIEALKIVWEMARGNLHCPQDEQRRKAMKVIKNLINKQ